MYNGRLANNGGYRPEPGVDHKEVKEALQPMMGEDGAVEWEEAFKPLRPIWQEVKSSSHLVFHHLFRVARDRHHDGE